MNTLCTVLNRYSSQATVFNLVSYVDVFLMLLFLLLLLLSDLFKQRNVKRLQEHLTIMK